MLEVRTLATVDEVMIELSCKLFDFNFCHNDSLLYVVWLGYCKDNGLLI